MTRLPAQARPQHISARGGAAGAGRDARAADWAEFAFLKGRLGLSDSALSKQLAALEAAGYVTTERRLDGSRRKVRAHLTERGRNAFTGHIAALQEIVAAATLANPATPS